MTTRLSSRAAPVGSARGNPPPFAGFHARVRAHVAEAPSRVALTFRPSPLNPERVDLAYGELVERSLHLARVLSQRVEPGERVLLLLPAAPEFAVTFLGCLAAGVVGVPLPIPLDEGSERRVLGVLRDSAPSLIVSMRFVHERISAFPAAGRLLDAREWLFVEDARGDGGPAGPEEARAVPGEEIAFLQYTSGSTSTPRGVMVSHRGLMANEAAIQETFRVSPESTIVSWLPLHHDMGLIGGLLQPLYAGARGVILDPLSFMRRPASWLETISEEQADISGAPNFAYDLCVRKVRAREKARLDLRSWRIAFNGAAPVLPGTLRSFSDGFRDAGFRPSAHVACYGLAEATLLVTAATDTALPSSRAFSVRSLESGAAREAGSEPSSEVRELPAYPLPSHSSVRVVDPSTAAPLPDGRVGEIVVAGEGNGSGYWGDPEGSRATFDLRVPDQPGTPYLRTGDLGFVSGGALFILGRRTDVIIHRGRNLHPEDLEADLPTCDPALRPGNGAVFGVPHEEDDEAVVVCQELRGGTPPHRHPEIAHGIRATLARVHGVTARTVVLLPPRTVPKTTSGKIQRHHLRRRLLSGELPVLYSGTLDGRSAPATSLADRLAAAGRDPGAVAAGTAATALASALCEHLRDVLGLPATPTGEESLVELGADSLTALHLQSEIEEALGLTIPPGAALRAASIAGLAAAACDGRTAPGPYPPSPAAAGDTTAPAAGGAGYELTAAQRALWFLQRVYPARTDYNITRAFRVTGALDVGRLATALGRVAARHPSLRLGVRTVDGEPRPFIRPPHPVRVEVVDARSWDEDAVARWHRELATTPFDLEEDPLLRAVVLRRAEEWALVLSLHHIACDGASLVLLVGELAEAYQGGPEPDPAPAPSADDGGPSPGARERAILDQREDELVRYWRRELAGEVPRLSLPVCGGGERGDGASTTFTLDAERTSGLKRLARESGLTLHNLLLSAWQLLLHRLTGQADVLVGVPTSVRSDPALAKWVGYLVNVVPIRSAFHPRTPFIDFARRTQRRVLDALDHRDLPLSTLTRILNPERDSAAAAIFQAMFAYYTPLVPAGGSAAAVVMGDPEATLPLGPATLRAYPLPEYTAQAEVCLNVSVRGDTLAFEFQHDPEKVSAEQMTQVETTFRVLVESIAERPAWEAGRLPLLTPREVQGRVAASWGPRRERPLHYLRSLEEAVERQGDRTAADDGVTRSSYAEIDERSNHVAWRLRELGVGIDANVVVSAARSVDYLVTLLGIHKAGGCYVPVSPGEPPQRAAAMVAAVHPVVCVADPAGRDLLARARRVNAPREPGAAGPPAVLDLRELAGGRSGRRPADTCPGAASSYIMHTSGSTGVPKPVVLTHAGLTNHLWQMIEYFDLGPDDCVGQTGPVSFDISVWQLLAPLLIGARVRIVPEPASVSPGGLLDAMVRSGITLLELVPSAVAALLDAGLARSPGALRIMIPTGEALSADLPRRWRREMPSVPLYNAYGPCECTDDVSIGLSAWGPDRPTSVSIGRPLTNTSMFILDDEMMPAPVGVAGWLCVGGAGVGRGYLGNPGRTAEVFIPDPWSDVPGARLYRTGDLGRMSVTGEVEFLGRADTQIKIRGVRIEPGEVEAAACECEGVLEAAVKVERGPAGDFLVCYLVLDAGGSEEPPREGGRVLGPDEDERLRAALAERLPRRMIPSVLVRVPALPRSANGKTDYRALRYTPPDPSDEGGLDAPDDPLATMVRAIWAAHFGRKTVGWNDDFFQLGGHSLLALSMIDQVGQAAGAEVAVDLVFAHPRLHEFVRAVRRSRRPPSAAAATPRASAGRGAPVPASAAQQRFWFLHETEPGRPTFNMPGVLRLRGRLDDTAFEAALREVLERHSVLLARFGDEGGTLTWRAGSGDDFVLRRLDLRGAVAELGEGVFDRLAADEARVPVDLRREIPFRAVLARLDSAEWRLFISIHHIVCDGWSLDVFLRDLAGVRGGAPAASGTRLDFADYCHHESERRVGTGGLDLASEWRGVLAGPLRRSPRPGTPRRAPRPGPAPCSFAITSQDGDALRDLAGRTGATPFMVFATALSALIHSGSATRETIVLGTLIAQRDGAEWRRVVGPLLNVSVLAVELALHDTVPEALRRARDGALRAYRSSHAPYQDLVRLLDGARGGGGSLFDVLLVMQPDAGEPIDFDGLATELVEIDTGVSPYPLVVDVERRDGGYRVMHRAQPERYAAADVAALSARLEALTRAMVTDSGATLEEILRRVEAAPPERS